MKRNERLYKYWKSLSFKYKLSILNEKKLEEVFYFRISWLSGLSTLIIALLMIIVFVSTLIISTPIKNYLPGYLDVNARKDIVNSALRLDSLEQISGLHDKYLDAVKKIVSGDLSTDSINSLDSLAQVDMNKLQPSQAELDFRAKYEEEEYYNLNTLNKPKTGNIVRFMSPVNGVVTKNYTKEDLGIGLLVKKDLPVRAIADGTIILIENTDTEGLTILLQHDNNWLSTYKGIARSSQTTGSRVTTGETIGITGDNIKGKEENLFFQLWNKGRAVNPIEYITF
ncbi:MAG: murein hydrolase activator EnvC family protein [Bacteroidales bacterium]